MPFFDGYELISYALEEESEDKLFLRWAIGYQSIMGFDEFKNQIGMSAKGKSDSRTEEEIFNYVMGILR